MQQNTDDEGVLGTGLSTRNLEAFGRKVTTTAGQLIGPFGEGGGNGNTSGHYTTAIGELHKEMRQPALQRRMFSMTRASPMEVVRSKLSTSEIQYRALTYLPDELLANIPAEDHTYSLFQGFQATLPRNHDRHEYRKSHRRHGSRGRKLLTEHGGSSSSNSHHRGPPALVSLKTDKDSLSHRLEMLGIRKSMSSSEIRELDGKLSNLQKRRRVVLDRLAELEQEEALIERDLLDLDNRIEMMQEELDENEALAREAGDLPPDIESEGRTSTEGTNNTNKNVNESFMSQSIYEKLPSPKTRRHKNIRRKSMPILHEHIEPGTRLNELQAHNDMITALDFDAPFGTMVTAALDDTVRVWDLNAGRCIGMLEGHHASVRCLQVEDNIVATGSADASVRLWDLSRAEYIPRPGRPVDDEDEDTSDRPTTTTSSMQDCALFSLEAHVDEVTALYFRGDILVSGSADKTLRQWDLVKGRCVQTLDVLWAAAQASSTMAPSSSSSVSTTTTTGLSNDRHWRQAGRLPDASADFVGALQCFDAALACGTADGMVRLWDLRSGQVLRSLVGHTGPVTCLQFDDVHLVTGSLDRSIRIWDLRTGSIHDAYAYDNPITSMQFDTRRIVAAAGEDVVKVYDKVDGRHWDCGGGDGGVEDVTAGAPTGGDDPFFGSVGVVDGRSNRGSSISGSIEGGGGGSGKKGGGGGKGIIEQVRIKEGYMIEGRKDGVVGIWAC
ncbi:MAG: GMP synthase (glutamine-hydrolyzing) [Watsoniomyces obsoletus]|nr:MAG: GMP synthase (glutamine-hydrolyzing) [Watsoniomyces obsoletus]